MAAKKRTSSDNGDLAHGFAAIVERMEEQNRAVMEAVLLTRESLNRRMDDMEQRMTSEFDVVKFAIRKNSEDIQRLNEAVRKNSEDIQQLNESVGRVEDALDTKADAARVDELEQRISAS